MAAACRPCELYETDVKQNGQSGKQVLMGHGLAKAHDGPLLVGFGEGKEDVGVRRGRIWAGGVNYYDSPFYLYLKNGQQALAPPMRSPPRSTPPSPMTPKSNTCCSRPGACRRWTK